MKKGLIAYVKKTRQITQAKPWECNEAGIDWFQAERALIFEGRQTINKSQVKMSCQERYASASITTIKMNRHDEFHLFKHNQFHSFQSMNQYITLIKD